ncbi:MAG: ATPase, T2SS/T4P/T4SS family [bacterium]
MRIVVYLIALLILTGTAYGDEKYIFHLRNGQRLVGEVLQEEDNVLTIETRDGRVTLKREEIDRRSPYPVDSERVKAAEEAVVDRRYLEAITLFREAYGRARDSDIQQDGQRRLEDVVDQWVSQSQRLTGAELDWSDADRLSQIEGLVESADVLERLKAEVRRIRDVRARHLLSVAERLADEKKYEEAAKTYRDLQDHDYSYPQDLAKVYLRHGIETMNPPVRDNDKALRFLLRAKEADPELFYTYLYLAHIYLELRNVEEAEKAFREAGKYYDQFSGIERNQFTSLKARLSWVSKFPTFAPIPTVSPDAIAKPQRTAKEEVRYWRHHFEWLYRTGQWKEGLRVIWPYIAAVIGAWFFLWFLPWRYVRRDSFRRTLMSPKWNTAVFFTGILGLLAYLGARAIQEGRRPRCKRCGYNLSRAGDYADYDYSHCPSCKAPIRPVFSLVQEIVARARLLTSGEVTSSLETGSEEELFHLLCLHAFRSRAERVDLESDGREIAVIFFVDGIQHPVFSLPGLIGRILFPIARKKSNIDSSAPFPQTGYFMGSLDDADVEARLTITPGDLGESLSMRLIDRREALPNLTQIIMDTNQQSLLRGQLEKSSGMVAVAGPPRSGKTTLVYAMLTHLNDGQHYLATLEDSIHLELPGVVQVREGSGGLRGKPALEAMIRQNVDVLFVNEVRDRESVEFLLETSLTNRRAILCLESQDTVKALERFLTNELPPELLGGGLSMIIGVRLIRKLCSVCKAEAKVRGRDLEKLGASPEQMSTSRLFVRKGCEACLQTGYSGRTGIFEFLPVVDRLREAIISGQPRGDILGIALSARMGSFKEHALQKVLAGVTDLDELVRVVGSGSE